MAIRRRGKSWFLIIELGRDPVTGKRRRVYRTTATRKEAEQEQARLRHEAATGLDVDRIIVADYLRRWLDTSRPNLAPSTYHRYEQLLRVQVVPRIGGVDLAKLRPLYVQQLYSDLRQSGRADKQGGLSGRTVLHAHRVLSEALSQAVRWQLVARNPCQAVDPPHAARREMRSLTPDQTRHLLEAAAELNTSFGDAVIVAVHSGLRLGELLGLRWEDVDFEHEAISVSRALQYLSGDGLALREPKTPRARRKVPLGISAIDTLKRLRRRQLEERLATGAAYQESGLVFTDAFGGALKPYSVSARFGTFVRTQGLGPLRFHDLRHAHATLLLARGIHPKIVSERLGHASIGITLDTYSHVLPGLQEEAVRDLDSFLAGRS